MKNESTKLSHRKTRAHALLVGVALGLLAVNAARAGVAGARQYLKNPDAWFKTSDAARIGENILSHQSDLGGWPKNEDTTAAPFTGDRSHIKPTFDNNATTDELRFLARFQNATHDARSRGAFARGLDYILKAQYPTGGWPQYFPPDSKYHRRITFNDNSMVRLMEFLRETCTSDRYAFLDAARKKAAREAFDRGIGCILKCQIRVDGRLTAWCAQHDENDYSPQPGRAFELTSISGSESVGITRLLMSLDPPGTDVIRAVEAAVAWFRSAQLKGIRLVEKSNGSSSKKKKHEVVEDAKAPPVWARFYDIRTNAPIFSDRDGVVKQHIDEISSERRNGYAWYGTWPAALLETEYPAWRQKWAAKIGAPAKK